MCLTNVIVSICSKTSWANCILKTQIVNQNFLFRNNAIAHVDLVDKLQKNVKQLNKSLQNVTKDLATLEAQKFKNQPPTTPYFILHRSGVAPEFINAFLKEVGTTPTLLCISVGEDKGPGNITLHGDNKDVKSLGSGWVLFYFLLTWWTREKFRFCIENCIDCACHIGTLALVLCRFSCARRRGLI